MRYFLILFAFTVLFLFGCEEKHIKIDDRSTKNSCLVDAAVFQAAYTQKERLSKYYWTEILLIKWKNIQPNGISGHAACLYVLDPKNTPDNPKDDYLYAYDYEWGSRRIPMSYKNNPIMIAMYLYNRHRQIETAWFLK